jgi:hypothetical protein
VLTKLFNPMLKGKAVRLQGNDVQGNNHDGVYLVHRVRGDEIYLIDADGKIKCFHIYEFNDGELEMYVLSMD